jgi:peptidyl-prolyl cis-trans isomerase SurA
LAVVRNVKSALQSFVLSLASAALVGAALAAEPPPQLSAPGPQSAPAPQSDGSASITIAAVVNEDIITLYDVQSRLGLVIATSGLDNTPEIQRRLVPQIVDALIEERLKMQEARRLKIKVEEPEIRQAVDNIEARNNMQPGAFRAMLESRGIDSSALYNQIEADVSWVKVVRQSMQQSVAVGEDEVNAVLRRARANQGKPEYLVAEIVLPVPTPAQEPGVREMAARLVEQARGGAPFQALAQQFSQSPTAAVGGDLGWIVPGEMEAEMDDTVARMQPGQVSDPIRTSTGYHILSLRERRAAGAPDPNLAVVTLEQIYLPTEGVRALAPERVDELSRTISGLTSCEQMKKLGEELATPGSGSISPVYAGGLPPKVRDVVMGLQPGRTSPPIEVGGARLFIQVCMRRDDTGVPSADQIHSNLEGEKLQNAARQRLRDLRRQALIDVRL